MFSQSKQHGNSLGEQNVLTWENWYFPCINYILLHTLDLDFGYHPCCNLIWIPEICFTLELIHKYPFMFVNRALLQSLWFQGQKKDLMLVAGEISFFFLRCLMLLECKCLWERDLLNYQSLQAKEERISATTLFPRK